MTVVPGVSRGSSAPTTSGAAHHQAGAAHRKDSPAEHPVVQVMTNADPQRPAPATPPVWLRMAALGLATVPEVCVRQFGNAIKLESQTENVSAWRALRNVVGNQPLRGVCRQVMPRMVYWSISKELFGAIEQHAADNLQLQAPASRMIAFITTAPLTWGLSTITELWQQQQRSGSKSAVSVLTGGGAKAVRESPAPAIWLLAKAITEHLPLSDGWVRTFVGGAMGGAIVATLTQPADTLGAKKIQAAIQHAEGKRPHIPSYFELCKETVRQRGLRGLLAGGQWRIGQITASGACMLLGTRFFVQQLQERQS